MIRRLDSAFVWVLRPYPLFSYLHAITFIVLLSFPFSCTALYFLILIVLTVDGAEIKDNHHYSHETICSKAPLLMVADLHYKKINTRCEGYEGRTRSMQSRSSRPQTPQLGGPTLPKGAPNCLEEPEVASIQKQSFAWRIALNGIFCAQILYISVLKFFAIVSFQIAS